MSMEIGAQFYTVRAHCKTPEDFALALRKTADIGYKTVQISGTCAYTPAWLRDELQKNGLRCVLTHIPGQRILDAPELVAREHDVFGCAYVGLGKFSLNPEKEGETFEAFKAAYLPAAQRLRACGKYFMYHNHAQEFNRVGGRLLMERFADELPAELVGVTLDTYWAQVGGADPAQWLERLSGRIPCIHLKDCAYGQKMAVLGEGNINFDRVLEKAQAGGTKYLLVEQDDCGGEDPFDCLRRSYQYLRARGLQ